ncbi:putative Zn(II)2Cys6 transcription factor [Aspergillus mulundensis]|uniref:Putative Zn(II)2Cys6 transcription factor n=1 Tax=Aspergillus mulundensis TaxID=1810919 RepID=A0A3D8S4Y2_9EURO|nr:putative Zn(II)2Cys6 transcription factor [Aspergillus mulundensis]RDW81352.1 putative Zn(II)2Cys6 transcription factor [Aspergillus mulundensis]
MDPGRRLSHRSEGVLVRSPSSPRPRSASDAHGRQRKLRKVTRACDNCRAKKKSCTGTIPCGPCVRRKLECTYNTTYRRGVAVTPPPSDSLQGRQGFSSRPGFNPRPAPSDSPVPTPQQTADETISESTTPYGPPEQRAPADVADQYWGPTSAHSFLGWAVRDLPATPSNNVVANGRETEHVPKESIFHFGDRIAPEVQLADFQWPDREEAEALTRRYFDFACPTYRTLHQPTIEGAIRQLYGESTRYDGHISPESAASHAVLLMVFSTATMFRSNADGRMSDADDRGWRTSELYFVKAEQLLSQEVGTPRLESAQARFLMVLYLLSSSRANKAWFALGTAIQLMMALGLHSRRSRKDTDVDLVQRECRRRILWCSYTLDKYISVILGRPRLWHDDDVDEELPARVNDIDLLPTTIQPPKRDCVMDAPVFHALLSRTLSQAAKEPYVVAGISHRDQLNTIRVLCDSVAEWHAGLPPLLSGTIHPSSLVPIFQRQLTVLQLARYHILMFITRPLLLRNYGRTWPDCEASYVHYLGVCLTAARDTVELVLSFVRENQLFHAFWYSQYIAFNALSIIYIYLIQVRRGRIYPVSGGTGHERHTSLDEAPLYQLSETAQHHLADATSRNSPSWKYSAILQGLRRELERLGLRSPYAEASSVQAEQTRIATVPSAPDEHSMPLAATNYDHVRNSEHIVPESSLAEPERDLIPFPGMPRSEDHYFADPRTEYLFDSFATDKDLMLDFWPQLDSLPITYMG